LSLVDPHQRIISTANVPPQQLDWWAEAVFGSRSNAAKGEMPSELVHLLLEREEGLSRRLDLPQTLLDGLRFRLPAEIMDMVRKEDVFPTGPMSPEEAKTHYIELEKERGGFHKRSRWEWNALGYNFGSWSLY
jgi:hypothetical protein